jgi:hypothetical protein
MSIRTLAALSRRGNARTRATAASLATLILLGSGTAHAHLTFLGEDDPAYTGSLPLDLTNSSAAESAFVSMLVDPGTEDFSAYGSGDEANLDLFFRNPAGIGAVVETGTLFDPSSDQDGFIATALIAATGFPISGSTYWKNTTEEGEGLFEIEFGSPVQAFGFYATAYSTQAETGGTRLVLRFTRTGGDPLDTFDVEIGHSPNDSDGKAFYFGVIVDPGDEFERVTLLNLGTDDGDVIGFDDFTVAHTAVPEPSTALLLAGGVLALAASRRVRRAS